MGRRVAGATVLLLLGRLAAAEVDVQLRSGRVDVRATAAPLSQVLDRLARATGMKVVYQGPAPSVLVSLSLEERTPAEAVFGVLEGLGLNYAFVLDPAGTKVATLMLAGAAGAKTASSSPAPPPAAAPAQRFVPRSRTPPPAAGPDPSDDEGEDVLEEPDPDEAAELDEAEEAAETQEVPAAPAGPRGNVLQPPAQPVFPSSPFAPRAPMFVPQPDPQPTPKPPNP